MSIRRVLTVAVITLLIPVVRSVAQNEIPDRDIAFRQSTEFKLKERNDTTYTLSSEVSVEMKLLSERSTKVDYFTIPEPFYAPIKKLKVKVKSSTISSDQINYGSPHQTDVFLGDQKLYTIHFPSPLKINDVVSYSYQQQYSDVAFLPIFYIRNIDYISEYRVFFKHPDDVTVDFEFYFPRDTVAYTIDRTEKDETTLSFGKLDYKEKLKFFFGDDYHAAILVSLKHGSRNINPVRPEEYIAWYHDKTNAQPRMDSSHGTSFDGKLSGRTTFRDSLAAIHDFVRTTVRYVADERGMSAFIPRPPSVTMQTGFGDCKDRVALVSGLANEYGIPILTVLVPPAGSPKFTGVHVGMFNHVIGAYRRDLQLTFFDPTAKYCEFGNLPDDDVGKRVFVMEPGRARFETISVPPREPSLDVAISGNIDSLSRCRAEIVLRNGYMSSALHARHDLTEEKLKEMLASLVATRLYQVRLDSFKVTAEEYGSITVTAIADLSKFILASDNKYYVPRTPFAQFDNDILERENDRYPLEFSATVDMRFRLRLSAPNITVQSETVNLGNEAFSFSAKAGVSDRTIRFDYRYRGSTLVVPTEDKAIFIKHYKAYLDNKKNVFVMTRR